MERQQKRFDEFRRVYNDERPREALGQKQPATIYRPSPRPYPETLPPAEYAGHLETRKVGQNGMMRWKNGVLFTSKTLRGERVGLARRSTTASGRSTTDRCCSHASMNGKGGSVGNSYARAVRQSTTRRASIPCVIDPPVVVSTASIVRIDPSADAPRSGVFSDKDRPSRGRTTDTRCNLCARSDLSPMFPAAG